MNIKYLYLLSACFSATLVTPSYAQSISVVNDDFSVNTPDQSNTNTDAAYYGSSSTSALEFGADFVGLVSGPSGRTIHALFETQTLSAIGDTITLSATFTTPATVATGSEEFRMGIFDNLGRTSDTQLGQNTNFNTSNPNTDYNGLPGFYTTIDIEADGFDGTNATDLDIREAFPDDGSVPLSGTFIAENDNFNAIPANNGVSGSSSGPDFEYAIVANTSYTFTVTVERTAGIDDTVPGDELTITSELFEGQTSIASHSVIDIDPLSFSFGMFGAQAGSDAAGSNADATSQNEVAPADNDNGIDFTSLIIDANITETSAPTGTDQVCFPTNAKNGGVSVICLDE